MPSPDPPLETPPPEAVARGLVARLDAIDRTASRAIAERLPHPRWLTAPIAFVSLLGNYGFVWILVAAVAAMASGGGRAFDRFAYVVGAVLATQGITFLVKIAVRRKRPPEQELDAVERIRLPASPSFPSSHASMSTVGALTSSVLYPSWWPLFVALALTLAISRVYLRVHYLADVLAGVGLGLVLGLPYVVFVPHHLV